MGLVNVVTLADVTTWSSNVATSSGQWEANVATSSG